MPFIDSFWFCVSPSRHLLRSSLLLSLIKIGFINLCNLASQVQEHNYLSDWLCLVWNDTNCRVHQGCHFHFSEIYVSHLRFPWKQMDHVIHFALSNMLLFLYSFLSHIIFSSILWQPWHTLLNTSTRDFPFSIDSVVTHPFKECLCLCHVPSQETAHWFISSDCSFPSSLAASFIVYIATAFAAFARAMLQAL